MVSLTLHEQCSFGTTYKSTMLFWCAMQLDLAAPFGHRQWWTVRQQHKEHLGHIKHCTLQLFLITLTADDKLGIEDCLHQHMSWYAQCIVRRKRNQRCNITLNTMVLLLNIILNNCKDTEPE